MRRLILSVFIKKFEEEKHRAPKLMEVGHRLRTCIELALFKYPFV
jgi:hypothetical protein